MIPFPLQLFQAKIVGKQGWIYLADKLVPCPGNDKNPPHNEKIAHEISQEDECEEQRLLS